MLVEGSSWRPEPDPDPGPGRSWSLPRVPWRPFAWFAAFCWALFAAGQVGGLAGYLLVLVAVGVGSWRLNRFAERWEWGSAGDSGAWR